MYAEEKEGSREKPEQIERIYSRKYARPVQRNRHKIMQKKQKALGRKVCKQSSNDVGKKVCKK